MARLRIRVELNRGGVGIPLHKLSSVVQEAEKFFQMLGEDVRIQKDRGEWLAFDFDNESLNFTAEFVGPASPDQVRAFAAAFDGTTSLRRATIAQFTHITDAIGEDELIGFGLYHSDQEVEPSEWRCLSRRDALRIAEEIQVLLEASGEQDQPTHLPAVADPGMNARLFKERHERGIAAEQSKWPTLVREVEANLSRRIARLENEVEDHSHAIHDLRDTSGASEESFRNLLSSVETFCAQATRQLEKISPPAQLPAPASQAAIAPSPEPPVAEEPVHAAEPAPEPELVHAAEPEPEPAPVLPAVAEITPEQPESVELEPVPEQPVAKVPPPSAEPVPEPVLVPQAAAAPAAEPQVAKVPPPSAEPVPEPVLVLQAAAAPTAEPQVAKVPPPAAEPAASPAPAQWPIKTTPPPPPRIPPQILSHLPARSPIPPPSSGPGWRSYALAAVVIIGIVSAAVLLWSPKSGEPADGKVTAASIPSPSEAPPKSAPAAEPTPSNPSVMHVDIEALQPAWVSITDANGKRLMARTFEANETRSLELTAGATLRTGNAGGLVVRFNGKEIGPLGPIGKIRDISFKDGTYRVHVPDAG